VRTNVAASVLALVWTTTALSGNEPTENPVSAEFRKHLSHADRNRDGFVTKEELTAEIASDPNRTAEQVDNIVAAMIQDLDSDHDGRLSKAEVAEGARRAGENAITKQDVSRAQQLVDGIAEYKQKHDGAQPANLQELARLHLVSAKALNCALLNGSEQPWGYRPATDSNAVMIFSPGSVNSEHQYIVALGNGRVLGVQDTDFDLDQILKHNMHVYPDK
jgi:transcription termination factor NusB